MATKVVGRIVSVFGKRFERVLVEMPTRAACDLFDVSTAEIRSVATKTVTDAVERDLSALRKRDPVLADSALAATARALARELDDPFNSATSKSMIATALTKTLELLRELAPEEEKSDRLDELSRRRADRLAGT